MCLIIWDKMFGSFQAEVKEVPVKYGLTKPVTNAANPLKGINITGGTTVNAYYNSVYLNGSSAGALFGSSAFFGTRYASVYSDAMHDS